MALVQDTRDTDGCPTPGADRGSFRQVDQRGLVHWEGGRPAFVVERLVMSSANVWRKTLGVAEGTTIVGGEEGTAGGCIRSGVEVGVTIRAEGITVVGMAVVPDSVTTS